MSENTEKLKRELEDAASGFVPKTASHTVPFAPALLKSSLFSAAKGERAVYFEETELASHPTVKVFFTGEALQQDDLRVLLALIKLREGSLATRAMSFAPREFCVLMGRADSSTSVKSMRESLVRLQRARVRVQTMKFEGLYSFVSDVEFAPGKWRVWLSERVADVLAQNITYINKEARFTATDGLQSWLYTFVRADACFTAFKVEDLQAWSGMTTYVRKEFARHLRKQLTTLQDQGVIAEFEMLAGGEKVQIYKTTQ
ncbi:MULTISPECIES: replication initiator protein A [Delftia]|uniref:Replication initiator protein A n=1 Tax=Delftia lacustris TaxID=558537 RepID=A0A7T2YRS7_9BURK|nr:MULTISPECIES: replication initiator protein A [Delftia]EPD46321.1 hypothetical protein HMPREF9702_00344 [Delftia acidovorans CCUG 15835]QPS80911.1 replication initiator protein A [Delftia lacustris]